MTTGDEGYHLSYAYNQFSSTYPEAMSKPSLRAIETEAIGGETGVRQKSVSRIQSLKSRLRE